MAEKLKNPVSESGSHPDPEDDLDYETRLSNAAADALQEFFLERELEDERLAEAQMGHITDFQPQEDWQLSQFWYDDKTAEILAREALAVAGEYGRIACVSSPTVYRKLVGLKSLNVEVKCLEYDRKFEMFGNDFIFYDFNEPLDLDTCLKNHFDVVIADPPFLSEECLTKTALTLKYLARDKIILCTGAVMESLALKLLNVSPCEFRPTHQKQLQNEFLCYTNYESETLNSGN
ncbi:unnamed protein product [Candidula unifasciata]|uniref:Protein-lysine N-methyltransferase CUNI_LOCUS17131 n=1 Tax=Candidula unifasciata TaxID=100452 RepID=A0A8S3ZPW6_9EUPU|nr:unnamed protein product [Candidula unifasciata]